MCIVPQSDNVLKCILQLRIKDFCQVDTIYIDTDDQDQIRVKTAQQLLKMFPKFHKNNFQTFYLMIMTKRGFSLGVGHKYGKLNTR